MTLGKQKDETHEADETHPSWTKSLIWLRESHNPPLPAGIVEDESPMSEGGIFLEFHMEDVFCLFFTKNGRLFQASGFHPPVSKRKKRNLQNADCFALIRLVWAHAGVVKICAVFHVLKPKRLMKRVQ